MSSVAIFLMLHLFFAVVWVGGMLFAHTVLRPAAMVLPLEQRVQLWLGVLERFFVWVWASVVVLPVSGYVLTFGMFGGMGPSPVYVHAMHGVAWVMVALFFYVYFRLYPRMRWMVAEQLFPEAGLYLAKIRTLVSVNLFLGVGIVVAVSLLRYG
jgi:uncharacterized membrane protein